jgi:heat-inducible transcriptional repressor
MLAPRTGTILRTIVGEYIVKASPVPSQNIMRDYDLGVSSATIRNEMARLERDGYITRPHPSAGGVPSDLGYRYYVESLEDVRLPTSQQYLIDHVFHQVETKLEEWLSLTATLLSHLANNMAVVVMPKAATCRFKQMELVSLKDTTALLVLVLRGAHLRQELVTFDRSMAQEDLAAISAKLNAAFSGMDEDEIAATELEMTDAERQIADLVIRMMRAETQEDHDDPFLEGMHFMLDQPEFADGRQILTLLELTEHRNLLRLAIPRRIPPKGVQVIIGGENQAEAIRDYSVVVGRYGLPGEATGSLAVIGPTRMPYARSIAAIDYLSWLLSRLVARLYGREDTDPEETAQA